MNGRTGKLNGAVGNFAAHQVVCPKLDWPTLSQSFVTGRLGLAWNPYTTQIEPHDGVAELCDAGARYNTVLLDMARDVWGYVSLGHVRCCAPPDATRRSPFPLSCAVLSGVGCHDTAPRFVG